MNKQRLSEFVSLFEQYKTSEDYQKREKQSAFTDLAKEIISETLRNDSLKNEHLTGLIQMLKWDASDSIFQKYLEQNIPDKEKSDKLLQRAAQIREHGYTGAGKTAINNLTGDQLKVVKSFLFSAYSVQTVQGAKELVKEFDALKIPEIKSGIYSPWLHYINPVIFPITNNSHNIFLDWFEIEKDYCSCIDAFRELRIVIGEKHLGMLDFFTHAFNNNTLIIRFKQLIGKYKEQVREDKNSGEVYKWECVKHFQDNFNINADDFETMFKIAINKHANLLYPNSLGFILKAAKLLPEKVRGMFSMLYDEQIDLQIRIDEFQKISEELLSSVNKKYGKELNHQQDERTISFYLSMRFPEKYPLYKNDIYNLLVNLLPSQETKSAGKKYVHFIELSKIIIPGIDEDKELKELSFATLNHDSFRGEQNQMIFQDILWRSRVPHQYFIGACLLGKKQEIDKSTEFLTQGYWQTDYDNESPKGKKIHKLLEKVRPGDFIAIRNIVRKENTVEILGIGKIVLKKDIAKGRIEVGWLKGKKLYNGSIPGGRGAGNWWETLIKLNRQSDIDLIFNHTSFASDSVITSETDTQNTISMNCKNIILYGPPGTGKTYNSIDKAVEIALGKSMGSHDSNKIEFDHLRKEGQIEFVTFHQNYSYEDFMVGIRPDVEEGTDSLLFKKHYGIFYAISKRAKENFENSFKDELTISKEKWAKEKFEEFKEFVQNEIYASGFFTIKNEVSIYSVEEDAFIYTGKREDGGFWKNKRLGMHYSALINIYLANVNSRKDIKELQNIPSLEKQHATYSYEIVQKFKEFLSTNNYSFQSSTSKKEALKNYVLVIDEINRANISKVFGELITLLEDDKRLGEPNELKVTLPNGERDFGIPPNLYIIGTMNTADKSIALIDIALRRRFEFLGFYPIYEKSDKYSDEAIELLKCINEAIYEERKSADYLIGHAYFMKNQKIEAVLETKVIPLLLEYFSGKTEIVTRIFRSSNWQVEYNSTTYQWDITKNAE